MKSDFKNLPRNVKEAKSKGSLYYFTGKPCKNGHISKRVTINMVCWECKKKIARDVRDRQRAAIKSYIDRVTPQSG